jgi:hypothetical protein
MSGSRTEIIAFPDFAGPLRAEGTPITTGEVSTREAQEIPHAFF